MALDMLAREYEAEDSQTMTTTLFMDDDKPDGSDHEDTVIENIDDTIIQKSDTYIDQIIKSNTQYSDSQTFTSSPNTYIPYNSSHNIAHYNSTPKYKQQPSQDFLLILENFHKQLKEKNKENETLKNKLKQMTKDYDNVVHTNKDLKQEITKLKQNENKLNDNGLLGVFCKDSLNNKIEEYDPIIKWLQVQIKTDSNNKLNVEMLEQWKNSLSVNYNSDKRQIYDDEEIANYNENEKAPLLNDNIDNNEKYKSYENEQFETQKSESWITCVPWSN